MRFIVKSIGICQLFKYEPIFMKSNAIQKLFLHWGDIILINDQTIDFINASCCDLSAPCPPSSLSLRTALVRRGFITKDTSVCRLICDAIWRPY